MKKNKTFKLSPEQLEQLQKAEAYLITSAATLRNLIHKRELIFSADPEQDSAIELNQTIETISALSKIVKNVHAEAVVAKVETGFDEGADFTPEEALGAIEAEFAKEINFRINAK